MKPRLPLPLHDELLDNMLLGAAGGWLFAVLVVAWMATASNWPSLLPRAPLSIGPTEAEILILIDTAVAIGFVAGAAVYAWVHRRLLLEMTAEVWKAVAEGVQRAKATEEAIRWDSAREIRARDKERDMWRRQAEETMAGWETDAKRWEELACPSCYRLAQSLGPGKPQVRRDIE